MREDYAISCAIYTVGELTLQAAEGQAIQTVKGSSTTKTGGEIKFLWRVFHSLHGMEGMSYI